MIRHIDVARAVHCNASRSIKLRGAAPSIRITGAAHWVWRKIELRCGRGWFSEREQQGDNAEKVGSFHKDLYFLASCEGR